MKLAVALAVAIGSLAFAAPTEDLKERTKKSASLSPYGASASYGASYGPPCSGGTPLAPIAFYLAPQGAAQHYREEGMEEEHSEHARSYEPASYGAASSSAISLAPAASGAAVGYFPHSKIGPCGVPLLLSCSPNVVAGHLAHSAHSSGYSAPAYRQVEKQEETTELKEAMEKSWVEAEREANNHLGHHHHHLVGLADHHEVGEHAHAHIGPA